MLNWKSMHVYEHKVHMLEEEERKLHNAIAKQKKGGNSDATTKQGIINKYN